MIKNEDRYSLFLRDEIYRDYTKRSCYFQKNKKKEKTCGPVNYNGRRMKLDYQSGEMRFYELKEIQSNKRNSVFRTKRLLKLLLEMNDFDWFCTLTFDNEKINRQSEEDIYKAYEKFIHNIQQQFPTLRYVTVLELHKTGEIHFHMLLAGVPWQKLGLENSGKVCCHWATRKNKVCSPEYFNRTKHLYELKGTDGLPVYNITNFIYGFTTATRIVDQAKCKSYVSEYVEKALGSASLFKKSFYYSSNLRVPKIVSRCIGADFETPKDTSLLMRDDLIFSNAEKSVYIEDYNVAIVKISNSLKENLEKGLIPINEITPFDS